MANRVTSEDILRMNEIYYKTHVFAEVARQTGFSASTVRKYVDVNWKPVEQKNIIRFDVSQIPTELDTSIFRGLDNYGDLCVLTAYEKEEMKELWEEMAI